MVDLPFQYFTEADVHQRLAMPSVIAAVERAFGEIAAGRAHNVPRFRVKGQSVVLHAMTAAADYLNLVGWKQYTTTREGAVFHVGLYEASTGRLLAMAEANRLGQLRTGATTGVAVQYLSTESANVLGMIGAGFQAQTQVEAIAAVRPLAEVRVFSRDEERRASFARELSARLQLNVRAVESARDAAMGAPLVVTATSSTKPVLEQEWLGECQLLAAVGSNWPQKTELQLATIQAARLVVCDSIEGCRHEAGELIQAANAGMFRWDNTTELSSIVALGRTTSQSGLTIFKSVGMAIEDIATAALLLG